MSRSARNSWRVKCTALALLLPALALGACAKSNDEAMAEKLAAAEAAAAKAIAAQKAAENAAAVAAASRPAPAPSPEPTPASNNLDNGESVDFSDPPHGGLVPVANDGSADVDASSYQGA